MRKQRQSGILSGKKRRVALFATAVLLGATAIPVSQLPAIGAGTCYITVNMPGTGSDSSAAATDDFSTDLAKTDITVDYYQVASASNKTGNGYEFTWDEAYKNEEAQWNDILKTAGSEGRTVNADEVESMTQALAKTALAGVTEYGQKATDAKAIEPDDTSKPGEIASVQPGLYLVVPHGDLEDFKVMQNNEIATIARGTGRIFEFAPILLSVPNGYLATGGTIKGDTAVIITAKVSEMKEYGPVRIIKNLPKFEKLGNRDEDTTFIFEVKATLDKQEVYNDVFSMVFTKSGKQEKVIEHLPKGAVVTVKEIYSGGNYAPTSNAPITRTVIADDLKTETVEAADPFEFTNEYDDTIVETGSVTNHFEADGEGKWSKDLSKATFSDGQEEKQLDSSDGD